MNGHIASNGEKGYFRFTTNLFVLVNFVLDFITNLARKLSCVLSLIILLFVSLLVNFNFCGCNPKDLIVDGHELLNKRLGHFHACKIYSFLFEFYRVNNLSSQKHFCRSITGC